MDNENKTIQTSFIPKKPIVSRGSSGSGGGIATVYTVLSIIIFMTAIFVHAGAWFYRGELNKKIAKLNEGALRDRTTLESQKILFEDIVRFDEKIKIAKLLLDSHRTLDPLFNLLESQTIQPIRFRNFSYLLNPDGSAEVKMRGEADGFKSIAFQSNVFSNGRRLNNISFGALNTSSGGVASFDFSANLKPAYTSFRDLKEGKI